ncbi:MAG: apolipoprotein N-acyltransferase [Pseudomonadota bacterium]
MKHWRRAAAVILGSATVLSFAPFNLAFMPLISLAVWVFLIEQASSWRSASLIGFCWGLGYFGLGVQWVYTTVHTVGGMPWGLGVIMHALFAIYLSFYPACVAGTMKALLNRYGDKAPLSRKGHSFLLWSFIFPALWVASEWLRGEGYLGFNWLTLGYSQAGVTPIAGWARLIGVYGVSFWLVVLAGGLGVLCLRVDNLKWRKGFFQWLFVLALIMISGKWFLVHTWTFPNQKMNVSLIQGNVAQENKWNEQWQYDIFKRYTRLLNEAKGKIVIVPETALPVLREQLPQQWVDELSEVYKLGDRTVLLGLVDRVEGRHQYYNSIWLYGKYAADQVYHKRHLVPFGEFIPGMQWLGFLDRWWNMPLSAFKRGIDDPLILRLNEITFAPSICYEDGFSRLFRGNALQANVLLNISNDAWFGSGVAIDQHLQIAQMRSIESAKFMVRSNNTAGTAIIDEKGNIRQKLKPFSEDILEGEVVGYQGVTPFMRYGERMVLLLCSFSIAIAWILSMVKNLRK